MAWCSSCWRWCRGVDADGFCLGADRAELARRCGSAEPEVKFPAAAPGEVRAYVHRFHSDFRAWAVYLDGRRVDPETIHCAAVESTTFPVHPGFVQLIPGGPIRALHGCVEIRPVLDAAPASPAPVLPLDLPPVLPATVERGQMALVLEGAA